MNFSPSRRAQGVNGDFKGPWLKGLGFRAWRTQEVKKRRLQGALEGQGDLACRLMTGIAGATSWLIGVIKIIRYKFPSRRWPTAQNVNL